MIPETATSMDHSTLFVIRILLRLMLRIDTPLKLSKAQYLSGPSRACSRIPFITSHPCQKLVPTLLHVLAKENHCLLSVSSLPCFFLPQLIVHKAIVDKLVRSPDRCHATLLNTRGPSTVLPDSGV